LYFISYYLERGFSLEYLLNITGIEKTMLKASLIYQTERRTEEIKALYGVK